MQRLTSFAGGVRDGFRSQPHPQQQNQHPHAHQHQHQHQHHLQHAPLPHTQRPQHVQLPQHANSHTPHGPVSWSFSVPLKNTLPGPETALAVYASKGATERWTQPADAPEDAPIHTLPVHQQHLEELRKLCASMKVQSGVDAIVTVGTATTLAHGGGLQPLPNNNVIANVCLHGPSFDIVRRVREAILNGSPITLQSAMVPIDRHLLFKDEQGKLPQPMIAQLDKIADTTKADIFLLDPEEKNEDGSSTTTSKEQLRFIIYGDMLTKENAKISILVLIDRMLGMQHDTIKLDLTLHSLICGRSRKKIKAIESSTETAIYFPPIFPRIHHYCPEGAERRPIDEVVVTGPDHERIFQAKQHLSDLTFNAKAFMKDVRITPTKMDHLLLDRIDKLQTIMEAHASYILLPSIGQNNGILRIHGLDVLNVERTIRDVMGLTAQFYSAEWQFLSPRPPPQDQIQAVLSNICAVSGADVLFAASTFYAYGSDEACKTALNMISQLQFVERMQSNIHIKLELAVEHKEFVSGKKNGKINKIMNLANVQIVFDGFNEYNFYIDVRGNEYKTTVYGLSLVEMELPASLSFHVPDQYHKRIIGIGGQHIQQLMKKYSVFVKFSNAHDRGPVLGKEDETLKLDNVICRTPSRNAQNLELVKQEIMDMVNRPDAEQVTENVTIDRLLHRELISSYMTEIDGLEKKWNCKINFPGTEQASDVVLVSGPEFQVPNAIYDLLALVPESHEVTFSAKTELKDYLASADFDSEVAGKLRDHHVVDISRKAPTTPTSEEVDPDTETLILSFTRNDAGGLKDAIDFLIGRLMLKGLDTETVKGSIPRPKSDSFEDSLPFFESRLLHSADPSKGTDSPTRSVFGDNESASNVNSSSFFSKFRKPSSMSSFSSFMSRRNNNGTNSPGAAFFKHASSNASKASLASIESQNSYRNIWNDSGINLTEEPSNLSTPLLLGQAHTWSMTPNVSAPSLPPVSTYHPPGPGFSGPPIHPSFMFTNNSSSSSLLPNMNKPGPPIPGDQTPTARFDRYDPRASVDSGRPSTSNSLLGHAHGPGPMGHHR